MNYTQVKGYISLRRLFRDVTTVIFCLLIIISMIAVSWRIMANSVLRAKQISEVKISSTDGMVDFVTPNHPMIIKIDTTTYTITVINP